ALDVGGTIHVPGGTYMVSRTSALGSYAYALRINKSNTRIVLDPGATIKLADGQDCAVIRTARFATGEVPARLQNIAIVGGGTVDGNWDNQTWLGPDGTAGGAVLDGRDDQNGVDFIETDGCVFDAHVRYCAQDSVSFAACTNIQVLG